MPVFRIDPAPTFRCSVALSAPGQAEKAKLDLVFRVKGRSALRAWLDKAVNSGSDESFLGEIVDGWSGVEDAAGASVAYSPEALARLLDSYPSAGRELMEAYVRELHGEREKN